MFFLNLIYVIYVCIYIYVTDTFRNPNLENANRKLIRL